MLQSVIQMSNTLITSLAADLNDVHSAAQEIASVDAATKGSDQLFEALRLNFELCDERFEELKKTLDSMRFSCNKATSAFSSQAIANRRNEAATRMSNLGNVLVIFPVFNQFFLKKNK